MCASDGRAQDFSAIDRTIPVAALAVGTLGVGGQRFRLALAGRRRSTRRWRRAAITVVVYKVGRRARRLVFHAFVAALHNIVISTVILMIQR